MQDVAFVDKRLRNCAHLFKCFELALEASPKEPQLITAAAEAMHFFHRDRLVELRQIELQPQRERLIFEAHPLLPVDQRKAPRFRQIAAPWQKWLLRS